VGAVTAAVQGAGGIDSSSGVVTDSDGVEADGAGKSRSDNCGGGAWAINADDDLNGQGGLSGCDGFVKGNCDHVGESAEGIKGNGAKSNGFDSDACDNVEWGGLEGVGLEI